MTGSSEPNFNRPDADPFSHLHKMSTTAGLGSGDYVAINGTAIAALLLGLGSVLVLFNNLIFLLIPLVGIIAAILAFNQISNSNGTETGREIAAIGLLLAAGFGGYYSARTIYDTIHNRVDQDQIVSNVRRIGDLIKARQYPEAYALFDDGFKRRVNLPQFETGWQRLTSSPLLGNVQSLDWNQLLSFDIDPVNGERVATGMMLLKAQPPVPIRVNMAFRKEGGSWLVDQVPLIFPADAPAQGGDKSKASPFIGPPKP